MPFFLLVSWNSGERRICNMGTKKKYKSDRLSQVIFPWQLEQNRLSTTQTRVKFQVWGKLSFWVSASYLLLFISIKIQL